MAINVSVQYSDGLLPDIILLINVMKRLCLDSLCSHLNVLAIFALV